MPSKCPYALGPEHQHVLLRRPGLLFPQQQGSAQHHTPGTRDRKMVSASFPAAAGAPTMYTSKPVASHHPLFTIMVFRMSVGVWAAAGSGRERLLSAASSWRTALQLWLSKREELRKTGTKARQLHPLGRHGLPTTSPCFSKPYVHPLPQPPPPTQLANKQVRKP